MSKRSADNYLTKDDNHAEGWGGPASQGRLTSAQMANRKIAVPRGARRGGTARPRPGLGATSASIQQQQQSLPNFGQPSPSIPGGFTFGQQLVAPNQTSQSFPPFGNSSANSVNNDTNANGFSFNAPSTAFSFNTTTANNPFSNLDPNTSMPSQNRGFQGSIFNLEATPDATQNMSSPSQWSSDPAPKATANPFTWPSAQQPASQTSNPFSQSLSAPQQPSIFSQPSNVAEMVKDSSTNIFPNPKSQLNQTNESSSPKPNQDIFANLQQKDSTQSPASENPFAASITSFQEDQKTRPTNLFNQPANQPPLNPFNPFPKITKQPELNPSAADSMQTSPEGTRWRPGGEYVSSPEADGRPANQTSSSDSKDRGGLFDRVTRPDPESTGGNSYQFFRSADSRTSENSPSEQDPQRDPDAKLPSPLDGTSTADSTRELPSGAAFTASKLQFGQAGDEQNTAAQQGAELTTNLQNSSFQSNTLPTPEGPTSPRSSSTAQPEIDYTKPHNEASTTGLDSFYEVPMPPIEHGDRRLAIITWRLAVLRDATVNYLARYSEYVDTDLLKRYWKYKVDAIFTAGEGPIEVSPVLAEAWSEILDLVQAKQAKAVHGSTTGLLSSEGQYASDDEPIANSQQSQALQPLPSVTSKRKADNDPPDGELGINGSSAKRIRTTEESPTRSQTSNLFSTILDSKQKDPSSRGSDILGGTSDFSRSTTQAFGLSKPHASSGATSEKSQPSILSASPGRQPTSTNVDTIQNSNPAGSQALKLPQFGNAPPGGWMAQFSQIARQDEEKAKELRKKRDYDSEEEDEAEWEQRDAETQRRMKHEIAEATKSAKKFTPNFGTLSSLPDSKEETSSTVTPQPKPKSIFDTTHPAFGQNSHQNIFGHLTKESHNDGGSKRADTEEEHDDEHDHDHEEEAEQLHSPTETNLFGNLTASAPSLGRSLFDRVSKPADETSQSGSDVLSSADNQTGDRTWKFDSPIKFGPTTSSPSAPSVNIQSPSPSKNAFASLFGASTVTPGGDKTPNAGTSSSSKLPSSAPSGAVGFGFTPAQPNTGNLNAPSTESSRAPSPGLTTGDSAAESTADGADEPGEQHLQLDLMSGRAGEEDENVVYEVRAKATSMDSQAKEFVSRGVGPLRILKHRTTGQPRALLRADPGGRISLNSGLMTQGKYKNIGANTISGPFADSKGIVGAWRLRVKTANEATELLKALEENTPSGA